MTAPCYHTGKKDSAGNELVECKCPVYDGPFELGQAGVPCDANELTPSTTRTPLTTRMPATAWQYTLRVDPATLENVRLSFAQESSGAGQPDRAQVEEVLTKAGVDPGDVQSFMARFLPPIQEQGYSDFYNGNQSDGSRPPDSAAALTQFNILIDAAYASAAYSSKPKAPPVYVWSAAHNPKKNPEPIDPPATGCLPDVPGDKGCPLYSPVMQYPVAKGSPLCRRVCDAYRNGVRQSTIGSPSSIQVGYSCDATLCTTLGIGQTAQPLINPLDKGNLLQNACGGLAEQSGLRAILALEQINAAVAQTKSAGAPEPALISTRRRKRRLPNLMPSRNSWRSHRSVRSTAPYVVRRRHKGSQRAHSRRMKRSATPIPAPH